MPVGLLESVALQAALPIPVPERDLKYSRGCDFGRYLSVILKQRSSGCQVTASCNAGQAHMTNP